MKFKNFIMITLLILFALSDSCSSEENRFVLSNNIKIWDKYPEKSFTTRMYYTLDSAKRSNPREYFNIEDAVSSYSKFVKYIENLVNEKYFLLRIINCQNYYDTWTIHGDGYPYDVNKYYYTPDYFFMYQNKNENDWHFVYPDSSGNIKDTLIVNELQDLGKRLKSMNKRDSVGCYETEFPHILESYKGVGISLGVHSSKSTYLVSSKGFWKYYSDKTYEFLPQKGNQKMVKAIQDILKVAIRFIDFKDWDKQPENNNAAKQYWESKKIKPNEEKKK